MTQEEVSAIYEFMNEMIGVRDRLEPILTGQIKRGHCLAGSTEACGATPGYRKTTLKDAREIAKHCKFIIDRAHNELDETLDWS